MNCNLAKDLLPLYIEGLAHEESADLLEQHLNTCPDCNNAYQQMKLDYESTPPTSHDANEMHAMISRLRQYQRNIKLAGVLAAMLLSCVITGANVAFLSTIPFIILVPFLCRLYYQGSLWIILSSIPFAALGAWINDNNSSYIPTFTVIACLLTCLGVGAAVLFQQGIRAIQTWAKTVLILLSLGIMIYSSSGYFSLMGNPIGYVKAMADTRQYVNKTYPDGTLSFVGVQYNFKFKRHYGLFEYVLNGVRQRASIEIYPDGFVVDSYKDHLDTIFADERSADLKTALTGALNGEPLYISAYAEEGQPLRIAKEELNDTYYNLSYNLERRDKATANRRSESAKLAYVISLGRFSDELDQMNKKQFVAKAATIAKELEAKKILYARVELKAKRDATTVQTLSFTPQTPLDELNDMVLTFDENKK